MKFSISAVKRAKWENRWRIKNVFREHRLNVFPKPEFCVLTSIRFDL